MHELSALLSYSNKQPPVRGAKNIPCFIWSLNTGLTVIERQLLSVLDKVQFVPYSCLLHGALGFSKLPPIAI